MQTYFDYIANSHLSYTINTCPGHTGSPIWLLDESGVRLLMGVHTSGAPGVEESRCENDRLPDAAAAQAHLSHLYAALTAACRSPAPSSTTSWPGAANQGGGDLFWISASTAVSAVNSPFLRAPAISLFESRSKSEIRYENSAV